MKMDISHPDAHKTQVTFDDKDVMCVAFDSEEGWADCFVGMDEDPYVWPGGPGPHPTNYLRTGEDQDPVIRRFYGKVTYVIPE